MQEDQIYAYIEDCIYEYGKFTEWECEFIMKWLKGMPVPLLALSLDSFASAHEKLDNGRHLTEDQEEKLFEVRKRVTENE